MTPWLRTAEAWLLAGWFGSFALFAAVIAPTAFRVLPSGEVAGQLVGPVLSTLNLYGMAAGVGIFAIAFALKRGPLGRAIPLLLAVLCAVSEFGVSSAISEVRPSSFDAETVEGAAGQFQQLHLLSRALFGSILLGTGLLIAIHARDPMFSSRPAGDD